MAACTANYIIYVFCGAQFKQVLLPFDLLDGEFSISLNAGETGYSQNISVSFLATNGIWFVNEDKLRILHQVNPDKHGQLASGDYSLLDSGNNIEVSLQVFSAEQYPTSAVKYHADDALYIDSSPRSGLLIGSHHDATMRLVASIENGVLHKNESHTFLNGKLVSQPEVVLRPFDCLLIEGIKLTWLYPMVAVHSTTQERVTCRLDHAAPLSSREEHPHEQTPVERAEVFFRPTPRVYQRLIDTVVTIDAPPQQREPKYNPLILTMGASGVMLIVMLLSVWLRMQSQSSNNQIMAVTSLLMVVASAVGTVLMPTLLRRFQKKRDEAYEQKRKRKYTEYIVALDKRLQEKNDTNRKIYCEYHMDLQKAYNVAMFVDASLDNNPELWNKSPDYPDFLDIRIGIGARESDIPIAIEAERFTIDDDGLRHQAQNLCQKHKYLKNVPVSISLKDNYITGLIGNRSANIDFLHGLILQLSVNYSYKNVVLGFVYDKQEAQHWNYVKWLPHSWREERQSRLCATTPDEAAVLFKFLQDVIADRQSKGTNEDNVFKPFYVVFILSRTLLETSQLGLKLLEEKGGAGVSFVFWEESFNMLPSKTSMILQNTRFESSYYSNSDDLSNKMHMFKPDSIRNIQTVDGLPFSMEPIAQKLFHTRIRDLSETSSIPEKLTFLEMYHANSIEMLNIEHRWNTNRTSEKIEAAVGVASGGKLFSLDIHEKRHGPHGLMAGTTGSGKSEFIQSFILSLAINYSPSEIAFVLIDFKGGGMANQFERLPHLAGIVTNLEEGEIHRSLNTLMSENRRRMRIFSENDVNNIDKYHDKLAKGEVSEPMPHLLIIVDEFAELRQKQPEFMNSVVSIARTGRSLGVHLILATQNPRNAVSEDVWSNSRFRICLRVSESQDSREILKRPDAAEIRLPGRAYVQVGNDEVFVLLQSGYSGAPYVENDMLEEAQKSVTLMDIGGRALVYAQFKLENSDNLPTQLSAIVDELHHLAERSNYKKSTLWLPALSYHILWDSLDLPQNDRTSADKTEVDLSPILGVIDDPYNLTQPLLRLSFTENGHLVVYGLPGSGKSTLLQTLIVSLARSYTPAEVNIYILDFAAHNMGHYKRLPHVGDVVFEEEKAKLRTLFDMLNQTIAERKRVFQQAGVSNYKSYCKLKSLPSILIILQEFAQFREQYMEMMDFLYTLARNGTTYGIYLVLTTSVVNAMSTKLTSMITQSLALRLKDKSDYATVFPRSEVFIPANIPGRGLMQNGKQLLEFHVALVHDPDKDDLGVLLKELDGIRDAWTGQAAPEIPVIPSPFLLSEHLRSPVFRQARENGQIPIGWDTDKIAPVLLYKDQRRLLCVLGAPESGKSNFGLVLLKTAQSLNWEHFLFSHPGNSFSTRYRNENITFAETQGQYTKTLQAIGRLSDARANRIRDARNQNDAELLKQTLDEQKPVIVVIDDFEEFSQIITNYDLAGFEQALNDWKAVNICFFVTLCQNRLDANVKTHPIYTALFKRGGGLMLGGQYNKYIDLFREYRLDNSLQNAAYPPGTGLLLLDDKVTILATPEADSEE